MSMIIDQIFINLVKSDEFRYILVLMRFKNSSLIYCVW